MKKALISLLLLLALVLSLSVCAHAEARLDFVTDGAGVLTDSEKQELRDRAAQISERFGFGVYIVVVDNYKSYINGNIENFAEEVFHSYGLGYGEKEDGVILAMSMAERDYDIYAHGDFGNYAFTDYGKKQLAAAFLDNFRRNDWAGGFRDYLDTCGDMLQKAKDGSPVDTWVPDPAQEAGRGIDSFKLTLSGIIGLLFGGATVGKMKHSMKTAAKQTRAENYVARGGVRLRGQKDEFVNRSVTRTRLRQDSGPSGRPGGGHHGGTTISGSHGGSHHSGKF